jgi:Uma2 family endonuclease
MTTAAPRRRYTLADYLDVELMSPTLKHELVGGEIFAMAGGSVEHAALSATLVVLLGAHLRGAPCRPYSSDLRIAIREAGVYTYSDVSVVCDPVQRDPDSPTHVTNPRVVVEVLSPSTEAYDRDDKRALYQLLPSLQEYVLVAQDRRRVEVWRRNGDDWSYTVHDAGTKAALPSIDLEIDVDELYRLAGVLVP